MNIKEVEVIDGDAAVGSLVKLVGDEKATGMIVQMVNDAEVIVLWSTPPTFYQKFGDIW